MQFQLKNEKALNNEKNWWVINGQGSSPFQMKWRVSISWSRLNISDLTNIQSATSFKILNDEILCTPLDLWNALVNLRDYGLDRLKVRSYIHLHG